MHQLQYGVGASGSYVYIQVITELQRMSYHHCMITHVKPSAVIKVAFGVLKLKETKSLQQNLFRAYGVLKLEEKYTLEQDGLVPTIFLQELCQDFRALNFPKPAQCSLFTRFVIVIITAVLPLYIIGYLFIIIIIWLYITILDAQVVENAAAYDELIEPLNSAELKIHQLSEALFEVAKRIFDEHSCG